MNNFDHDFADDLRGDGLEPAKGILWSFGIVGGLLIIAAVAYALHVAGWL